MIAIPEQRMTLKEITDLLDVRHDKAMVKVAKMSTDPEFGTMPKMDIVYNDKGQTVETYSLDKRQSIAVSAKLNTSLLMRIIDRWQKLENGNNDVAMTRLESAKNQVRLIEELEAKDAQMLVIQAEKEEVIIKLDEASQWSSIKKQEKLRNEKYGWQGLKSYSLSEGYEIKRVLDQNYGKVNSYHADVWLAVFNLEIEK